MGTGRDIGYGAYRNGSIFSPGGDATAGIRNRFAVGAVLCEDHFEHFSGEIRYEYQDGHPFLSSGAISKDIQGQSHTFTYDVLFHLKPRASRSALTSRPVPARNIMRLWGPRRSRNRFPPSPC